MSLQDWSCSVPKSDTETITLSHGSGGRLSARLIEEIFAKHYPSPELTARSDSAVLDWSSDYRLAMSTDAFVIQPLEFPGGDIGSLSIYGTVNDLAVAGAEPMALTIAWILEEGFSIRQLTQLAISIGRAAQECSVRIVAGDTKVVERGKGHGCYITTTGIGKIPNGLLLGPDQIQEGDCIVLSGSIGDHGMAIMSQRTGMVFEPMLRSDCAPLHTMTKELIDHVSGLRAMRDPTRGGIAATLNELASSSGLCFQIDEASVPIRGQVKSACELLGLDPWIVANEGKLIAIVSPEGLEATLKILRSHPLGAQACCIGQVTQEYRSRVIAMTAYGTQRIVPMPEGELLPRIC